MVVGIRIIHHECRAISADLGRSCQRSNESYPDRKSETTGTDTNGDYLRYKIELCTNSGMTANCQTFDQTSSQTGWSGQNTQTSTAYTSSSQATYTIQTPLTVSTTYYWRSYSIDPGGTNTWSSTQGAPYSFTTTDGTTNFTVEGLQLEGINLD